MSREPADPFAANAIRLGLIFFDCVISVVYKNRALLPIFMTSNTEVREILKGRGIHLRTMAGVHLTDREIVWHSRSLMTARRKR